MGSLVELGQLGPMVLICLVALVLAIAALLALRTLIGVQREFITATESLTSAIKDNTSATARFNLDDAARHEHGEKRADERHAEVMVAVGEVGRRVERVATFFDIPTLETGE